MRRPPARQDGVMIMHITPLIDPACGSPGQRLAWLAAGEDGRPLGTAFLWVPAAGGVADLQLRVHPAERRAGVGTRLLDVATDAAADRGMRGLLTEPVRQGEEGDRFCVATGLRPVLALTYTRLRLEGDEPTGAPVPGYRLIHWEGTVPDELANTFARSRRAMDDMPMGDTGYVAQPWDVERLHAIADAVARRDEILCTTAAVAADGEIVGFTEMVVPGDGRGHGQHYGTGVLPEHRGRGLARWMKAEQITWIRRRFPGLAGLLADTADSNTAMRQVNESLGYRATHRSLLYQRDLTAAN
ncbi:GNAT family N-acetyltransferase [Micromonospora sp. NPDC050495]|uniref:GNAT family N-acetyltransferase n=1 Tax=Micromonospora sp. NPDC050495 TaxID=3154936 RepID=UPI00340937E1